MPHCSQWVSDRVIKKFWGFLSGDELAASAEEVARHPEFDGLRYIVNDFLEVTSHDVGPADMERLAVTRFGSMRTNPNICVLLVTRDPGLAALADMIRYPVLQGSQDTVVFTRCEDALAWIERRPACWVARPRSI